MAARPGPRLANHDALLLKGVERHRVLVSAGLAGVTSARTEAGTVATRMDALAAALDEVDRRHGVLLKTTDKWNATKTKWAAVKGTEFTAAAASE